MSDLTSQDRPFGTKMHNAPACIMLSRAVLNHLRKTSVATLKVYIYLCSCREGDGKPFMAPISKITAATGLRDRAVAGALGRLRKFHLITRIRGRGSRPNQYSIPLDPRAHISIPHGPDANVQTGTQSEPRGVPHKAPAQTREAAPRLSSQSTAVIAPAPPPSPNVRDLIAAVYRPIDDADLAKIQKLYPDEAKLRQRLDHVRLRHASSAPDLPIDFFLAVLQQFGS